MPVAKQKPIDPRLGKAGKDGEAGFEPKVCAVSRASVRGRHQEQVALRDGYYYAVLVKFKGKEPTGLREELLALLPEEIPGVEDKTDSDASFAPLPDVNAVDGEQKSSPAEDTEKPARADNSPAVEPDVATVLTDEAAAALPPAVVEAHSAKPAAPTKKRGKS